MAPVLPYLTDSDQALEETVAAIAAAGATHVSPIVLHLRPGAREWWLQWLRAHHPELVVPYARLYRRGSYADPDYQADVTARVRAAAGRHGVGRTSSARWSTGHEAARSRTPRPPDAPAPTQLSLL
jgi:DNA repair photolyase